MVTAIPADATEVTMSQSDMESFRNAMRAVIFAPMEPGMTNPIFETLRQLEAAKQRVHQRNL